MALAATDTEREAVQEAISDKLRAREMAARDSEVQELHRRAPDIAQRHGQRIAKLAGQRRQVQEMRALQRRRTATQAIPRLELRSVSELEVKFHRYLSRVNARRGPPHEQEDPEALGRTLGKVLAGLARLIATLERIRPR